MSEWHEATVAGSEPEAADLVSVTLDVAGTALAGAHLHPGQYVKLRVRGGPGEAFFAIASEPTPGATTLEFLVKRGAPVADALVDAAAGTKVELTTPQGKGFPLEQARGKDVLLFATGSGISPIRSTLLAIHRHRRDYGDVTLYFGVRTPDAFAYLDEVELWQRNGIRVLRTVSRPGVSGWTGLTGYVQAHVGEVSPHKAIAFLCGQKAMVQGVKAVLMARGFAPEQLFLNW